MTGTQFPIQVPVLAEVAGTAHIVYGSDSCWTPAAAIDAAPPPGAVSRPELTSGNADRVFNRDVRP